LEQVFGQKFVAYLTVLKILLKMR